MVRWSGRVVGESEMRKMRCEGGWGGVFLYSLHEALVVVDMSTDAR